MIVGIDANEANIESRVGVNKFAYELLVNLHKLQANPENNTNPIKYILYLKQKPLPDMPKEGKFWQYKVLPGRGLWILTKLTPHLLKNPENLNCFYTPSHYLPPFLNIPSVVSIMDLGYLMFSAQFRKKDFWQLKFWTARSISISKYIISISNSTKDDIVRHYPKAKDKITVAYPGYDKQVFDKEISNSEIERVKNTYTIVGDYILYLSTLKPSKNVEGLIEAFSKVKKEKGNKNGLKLVIAGKKGWLYESIFERVKKLGLEKDVVFTGFVREKDKPILIKGASVFVLPSFWEGFGLDPLYAMALGVPVVVSDKGSLPEVVGKAGFLVNPKDIEDISRKIIRVLGMDKQTRSEVIKKGKIQASKFSWEKSAKIVREVIKKATRK